MKTLCLIGCTKSKHKNKMQAKELYMKSNLFRLCRKWCENKDYDYVIISAKYGVLEPDIKIEYYDETFKGNKKLVNEKTWVITKQLSSYVNKYDKIIVLCGKDYIDTFKSIVNSKFSFPLTGMGIGKRMKWLKTQTFK